MLAVTLALGSSIMWGTADFLGGSVTRRLPLLAVTLLSQAAGLVALLAVFAVAGAGFDTRSLGEGLLSGACGAVGLACFYRALALGTMSVVSPVAACGALVPLLLALAAGERPGLLALAGALLALTGAVLASMEEGAAEDADRRRAILLAVVAAVTLGGFIYLLGRASQRGDAISALLSARVGSFALLAVASAVVRPPLREALSRWWIVAAVGLLDVAANGLFAVACTRGLLAIVAVLGSLYPVTTVVLAHLVLGERITALQRIGVTLALAGVAVVSAS